MHKDGRDGKLSVRDIVKNALEAAGFKPPCEMPAAGTHAFMVFERELAISRVIVVNVSGASRAAMGLVTSGWNKDSFYLHRNESLFYRGV